MRGVSDERWGNADRTVGATQPSEECIRAQHDKLKGTQHPRGAAVRSKSDDLSFLIYKMKSASR